jgi:hypothetical protein
MINWLVNQSGVRLLANFAWEGKFLTFHALVFKVWPFFSEFVKKTAFG